MESESPAWLPKLLKEKRFFRSCEQHPSNEDNIVKFFCLDCCIPLCSECLRLHKLHRNIQIRRYVYNNVVKLVDLQKLFKCEQIQTYMANKAKVVYITSRRKVGPSKDLGNNCHQCDKSIQLPNRFCSLGCKVEFIEETDGSLMKFIKDWNFLPPLDVEAQNLTSNGDNASTSNNENGSEVAIMVPEGTVTGEVAGSGTTTRRRHRRKGIPHRSPFF